MKKNIKLPFTNLIKGGNNDSFKIMNNSQINKKIKNSGNLLSFIKKIFVKNTSNTNKIKYLKASETEEYYKKINSKNK